MQTRIVGLVMLCLGIICTYLNYYMRHNGGSYYPMLAFIAPLLIGLAVICVIEAPKLPIEKPSFLGWVCLVVGSLVGLWNAIF